MSLSSNHLDAFMALVEMQNFTQAAAKIHITQSALSQRILNLEEELKITLFIRDRAGLKLTEEALSLVRYCQIRNSLEEEFLNDLISQHSSELRGVLKVGGFSSVMRSVIQPAVGKILMENQKLKLSLITREMLELPDMLKRGEIDYMILDDRLEREEMEKIHLGFEHNVLVRKKNIMARKCILITISMIQ
jgi:DNA-binding transcriptional LysR family regulator